MLSGNESLQAFGVERLSAFFQAQDAEGSHFVKAIGRERLLRGDFAAQGVLDNGSESGPALCGKLLGRYQESVR